MAKVEVKVEPKKLKVVSINQFHVNRVIHKLIKNRKNIKSIVVLYYDIKDKGGVLTTQSTVDTLWILERYKHQILSA